MTIRSLFKKLRADPSYFTELYKIIENGTYKKYEPIEGNENLALPKEFIPLWKPSNSMEFGIAMSYLRNRGITKNDILRYNIGYAEQGEYRKRVIIPSYDKEGNVNFFAARSYYDSNSYKYMLPPWSKDIIGFELLINWREPVTIVESPFNAITIRNNSIPLFGKTISNKLKETIIENKVNRVNICLDSDAERESLKLAEMLLAMNVNVYFVKLTKKDPNEIGFEKMYELIKNSNPIDFSFIIKHKLNH
jgi:DNA primase